MILAKFKFRSSNPSIFKDILGFFSLDIGPYNISGPYSLFITLWNTIFLFYNLV